MLKYLITKEIKNTSPEIKWFLLILVSKFLYKYKIKKTISEFSSCFGVSKNVVSSSLNYFVGIGALNKETIQVDRNKFTNFYEVLINKNLIDELFVSSKLDKIPALNNHIALVEFVASKAFNQNKEVKLKLANRLLLLVLLTYADECGVVRNLGMSDLMKLTGMSRDRLNSQLDKLSSEGYIKTAIKGITGVHLFGIAKGVYYLDLNHKDFNKKGNLSLIVLYESHMTEQNTGYESRTIFNVANLISTKKEELKKNNKMDFNDNQRIKIQHNSKILNAVQSLPCINENIYNSSYIDGRGFCGYSGYKDFVNIIDFFKDTKSSRVQPYLQNKLIQYASFLLTHSWDELKNNIYFINEALVHNMELEILPNNYFNNLAENEFPSDDQKRSLTEFIYNVSFGLAKLISDLLKKVFIKEAGNLNVSILPSPLPNNKMYIAIEFYEKKSSSSFTIEALKPYLSRNSNAILFKSEKLNSLNDISEDDKVRYGLLTKVSKKSFKWAEKKSKSNNVLPE